MLTERRQLSAKLEAVEGVLETLAAADAKTVVYDPKFKIDPEKFEPNPARVGGAAQKQLIGKIPGTLALQAHLRGSGTATTDPDWVKLLKCCGFTATPLKSIDIGAITTGPFVHGETITGGTSSATGRVVFKTVNGATKIYFVSVGSGEFSSGEVLTGSTSGATATTSSVVAYPGREYRPTLSDIPSLSAAFNQDGYLERIKGARGNAKFSFPTVGQPGLIDFSFSGVDAGQAAASFLTGVAYEETVPPLLLSAVMLLDAYQPKLNSFDFDIGAKLAQREDSADAKGILSYALTGRKITGTLNLEMVTAATFDFRAKYHAGTEFILDITIGDTAGNKFRIYIPRAQIIDIERSDKDGLVGVAVQFQANGSMDQDDDLVIVQL